MKTECLLITIVSFIAIFLGTFLGIFWDGIKGWLEEGSHRVDSRARSLQQAIVTYEAYTGALPIVSSTSEEQPSEQVIVHLSTRSAQSEPVLDIGSGPTDAVGRVLDYWGHPYHIALDVDGNGVIIIGHRLVRQRVFVWSDGKNGVNEYGLGDDFVAE